MSPDKIFTSLTLEMAPSEGKIGTFWTQIRGKRLCQGTWKFWDENVWKIQTKKITWGFHPNSSGHRKVASFTACDSIANRAAPLFTPKWSWRTTSWDEDKNKLEWSIK